MKNGICAQCKSGEVFTSDFAPLQSGGSFLGLYNPQGNNLQLAVFLCANCGHIEINVADKSMAKVADLVKSDQWKKIG